MNQKKLLKIRPEIVTYLLGEQSNICLLSLKDILEKLKNHPCMILSANVRVPHVIPGIMKAATEKKAIIGFSLARSECDLSGGYTGQTPQIFSDTLLEHAEMQNFKMPFFIHGDHITVKDNEQDSIYAAKELIDVEIESGFTSFAIDASCNEPHESIEIVKRLSRRIQDEGYALEIEIGQAHNSDNHNNLTHPGDAKTYINKLITQNVYPSFVSIQNGLKHGVFIEGEEIFIDLKRTKDIYDIVKEYGVFISQHAISGKPDNLILKFPNYGIKKGNIGSLWQNITYNNLPKDLMDEIKDWSITQGKHIKYALRHFKSEIDTLPRNIVDKIELQAYEETLRYINLFHLENTASLMNEDD
ncbi:MAG: class II fructose-bisphosphate aldolase [Pseudomonadota bacterium]